MSSLSIQVQITKINKRGNNKKLNYFFGPRFSSMSPDKNKICSR